MKKLVFWEMNEINFDFVFYYIRKGKLNNWRQFIEDHGLFTTLSEKEYVRLEPWIQWPTVRTGLDYRDHKVFHLGDMNGSGLRQHWEILEDAGFKVAAISPINGTNNTKRSPFWIPDPWIDTRVSGDGFARRISRAVKQAVNDNAQEKLSMSTVLTLIQALLTRARLGSWMTYVPGIAGALRRQHWSKAVVFDRLIADIFFSYWRQHRPDFSVLFLNAGAHTQHHYMFSSAAYSGNLRNPEWYVPAGVDPLLDILELYDEILGELVKLPDSRLMISVGMRQIPYEQITYYWRLREHSKFLSKIGIHHKGVQPRMTRDFLVEFDNKEEACRAEQKLKSVYSQDHIRIFGEIDNRGNEIFVTLTYPDPILENFSIFVDGREFSSFNKDVVFVAIKNGHHDSQGYFLDSQLHPEEIEQDFPLRNIFDMVMEHFGICRGKALNHNSPSPRTGDNLSSPSGC